MILTKIYEDQQDKAYKKDESRDNRSRSGKSMKREKKGCPSCENNINQYREEISPLDSWDIFTYPRIPEKLLSM